MADHLSINAIPRRFLPLQGGCNFRDVGGYETGDGRTVKWGRVFRTGVLCYLTESDQQQLQALGVRGIFDLRRVGERTREPTCWPDATVKSYTWDDGLLTPSVQRFSADKENTALGMREAMIELYRSLPHWMAPRLRDFLRVLREDHSPAVIHCAAGKDRTGIAIAILLLALGVKREQVIDDYLLTNELGNLEQFMLNRTGTQLGVTDVQHPLAVMAPERRRALLIADEEYLDAAFHQIDQDFGGVDGYLLALGVDTAAQAQLQRTLLTERTLK